MREALGPFCASLSQVRRRSIIFLFVGTLVVWGLITWSYYTTYRLQRAAVLAVERGDVRPEFLYRLSGGGFACDANQTECRITDRSGMPIGDPFSIGPFGPGDSPDKDPFIEAIRKNLPLILPTFKADLAREAQKLAPTTVLRDRTEAMGTFFGILFVVLITSTFIGAEWRWGVWRSLLTHEPRRGRVLASKLAALWTAVAIGALVTLGVTAALDALFRGISDIDAAAGASVGALVRTIGRSILSLELYATVAAAFAMAIRTSFAGMAALLFILGDGLATQKFKWLRYVLPTQQIATLLPGSVFSSRPGYAWWPLVNSGADRCEPMRQGGFTCFAVPLKAIPHWRASVVLIGWIMAFALAAWAVLRARDVPQ